MATVIGDEPETYGTANPAPRSKAGFVLAILMVTYALSFIDRQILALLIAPVKADLSLSDTQIGLLQGLAFALLYMFLGLPFGLLADRASRKYLIAGGVGFWSLATMGCGLAKNFSQLFLCRIGVGVGEATLQPAAYSLLADYFPPHRLSLALSAFSIGAWLGIGSAFLIGGRGEDVAMLASSITGSSFSGWRILFVLVGLFGIPICLLIIAIREPARTITSISRPKPVSETIGFISRNARCFVPLFLGFSLLLLCSYSLVAWSPAMLIRAYGWTAERAGNTLGLCVIILSPLGLICGGMVADFLVSRNRIDGPILVGVAASALLLPPMAGLAFAPNGEIARDLLGVCMFVVPGSLGAATAAVQILTPRSLRGQVSAVYLVVVSLVGIAGGPFATAMLTEHWFKDLTKVGASLSVVGMVALPLSFALLLIASRQALKMGAAKGEGTA